jgi:hypothetical protein
MTKPTAFEEWWLSMENEDRLYTLPLKLVASSAWREGFNAGRQAERGAQIVPPEDTKREQEAP